MLSDDITLTLTLTLTQSLTSSSTCLATIRPWPPEVLDKCRRPPRRIGSFTHKLITPTPTRESAFYATDLAGTLVIPSTVTTIGSYSFQATKLTGLDLSKAAALVSIANSAFLGTDLAGTLVNQRKVTTIGSLKVLPLNGKHNQTRDRPRRVAFRRLPRWVRESKAYRYGYFSG